MYGERKCRLAALPPDAPGEGLQRDLVGPADPQTLPWQPLADGASSRSLPRYLSLTATVGDWETFRFGCLGVLLLNVVHSTARTSQVRRQTRLTVVAGKPGHRFLNSATVGIDATGQRRNDRVDAGRPLGPEIRPIPIQFTSTRRLQQPESGHALLAHVRNNA